MEDSAVASKGDDFDRKIETNATRVTRYIFEFSQKRSEFKRVFGRNDATRWRVLLRLSDYIDVVSRILRSNSSGSWTASSQVEEHLWPLAEAAKSAARVSRISQDLIEETKGKIKIDAVDAAYETGEDHYILNRLFYERNVVNLRSGRSLDGDIRLQEIDWPSEELNTPWVLFLPEQRLHDYIAFFEEHLSQDAPIDSNIGNNPMRKSAYTSLRYVYMSRHENNRYTRTIKELRARYSVNISLSLVGILSILIWIISWLYPYPEPTQQTMPPQQLISTWKFHLLIAVSGALGGIFSIALRFRNFRRITEMRATASMLISQACIGATTATIFALVMDLGLFTPSALQGWRGQPAENAVPVIVLVSFFVGLVEGIFLRLVERMEGMLGGRI